MSDSGERADAQACAPAADAIEAAVGGACDSLAAVLALPPLGDKRVIECCAKRCLSNKREVVMRVVTSLRSMSREELKVSTYTAVAVCMAARLGKLPSSARVRFTYFVPLVGGVCKRAFERVFGVSHRTLHLYRKDIVEHGIAPRVHAGIDNQNARDIDEEALVSWSVDVTDKVGDVVLVRVRHKAISPGQSRRYYSHEDHTLLPANFTWSFLTQQYAQFLGDNYLDRPRPSESSTFRTLTKRCATIRIRAPRDQVCDQCAIYRSSMGAQPEGEDAELFVDRLLVAKAMM